MNRTEYNNNFGREHYERINLVVPKGMKDIIKALASSKRMSGHVSLNTATKRAIDSSFFYCKMCLT